MLAKLYYKTILMFHKTDRAALITDERAANIVQQLASFPPHEFSLEMHGGEPYVAEETKYKDRLRAVLEQAGWKGTDHLGVFIKKTGHHTMLVTTKEDPAVRALQTWLTALGEPTQVEVDNIEGPVQINIAKTRLSLTKKHSPAPPDA